MASFEAEEEAKAAARAIPSPRSSTDSAGGDDRDLASATAAGPAEEKTGATPPKMRGAPREVLEVMDLDADDDDADADADDAPRDAPHDNEMACDVADADAPVNGAFAPAATTTTPVPELCAESAPASLAESVPVAAPPEAAPPEAAPPEACLLYTSPSPRDS